jgi:AcrR family transcriptional regulator
MHPAIAPAPAEGLRQTKKRRTRAAISAAAMELFAARGFDAVTVVEVAHAAGVSEKTVFNYFPNKEDLVFAGGRAALVAALRDRPPGTSLLEPFRAQTTAFLDRVAHDPVDSIVAVPRLVMGSPTLRDRLLVGWEREAAFLVPVIAEEAGVEPDDLVAAVIARTLAWTHRLVYREAFTRLLAGDGQRQVAADLREQARRAYDQLETGLAGYGAADVLRGSTMRHLGRVDHVASPGNPRPIPDPTPPDF